MDFPIVTSLSLSNYMVDSSIPTFLPLIGDVDRQLSQVIEND